jgi:putative ABC transport system permease protein
MTSAARVARAGCAAVRILVALQPAEFRRAFGAIVIAETAADIQATVPLGTLATLSVVAHALVDGARGVVVERASALAGSWRNMQNAFISDLRQAVRTLARDRGFTAVSLGTLSVGLALSVTVAVLVNVYLMRGLPYPDSHRLYDVQYAPPGRPFPSGMEQLDWRSLDDVLELSIAWDLDNFTLRGGDYPELLQGTWVTPGYVDGFEIRAAVGRGFQQTDFEPGRPMVAMISDRLWRTRFNGDRSIVGRTFDAYVNDRPGEVETFTVVGVLPSNHWHMNTFTEIMAPLRAPTYPYMVRLRDGVPAGVAGRRMTTLVRTGTMGQSADWRVELQSSHGRYVQQIRPLLLAVATATGLVLLIASANVGVLLTLRAARRRREMVVRQALGASAGQITRACAAEPLLLGVAATALGLGLAWITIAAVAPVVDHYLGRPAPGGVKALGIDPATLLLTVGVGLVTVAIVSVVPIWVTRRAPLALAMAGGPKGATEGPAQRRARTGLVIIEVAACLTLLVGAGLTIQSAVGMLRVEMGFTAEGVVVGRFSLRQRAYPDAEARTGFYARVLARSGEIDSAHGIALTNSWPLQQGQQRDVAGASSGPFPTRAGIVAVSPDYFDVLRIPLHEGRAFTPGDRAGSDQVALVSRTLATRLWGPTPAVGRQLRVAPAANAPPSVRPAIFTVVGVVGDTRHAHTDDDLADAYVPILQSPSSGVFVYLRASDAVSAERGLKQLLGSIDGDVAMGASRRLADILDLQRASARLLTYLLVVFAVFAAGLALVGIYAVVAYTVKQREREIAVRLAIGADRRTIARMFLGQGALVLGAGLVLGLVGALTLGRVLGTQLFGVEPADPVVLAGMTGAFALCGLAAVAWPARVAALLDPASALKE